MSSGFQVFATSNAGVAFEQVPLAEGVQAWSDGEPQLTDLPPHLVGGTLLRCPQNALAQGTSVTATAVGAHMRVFVAVEALRGSAGEPPRDGGLARALASTKGWLLEGSAPSWCGEASTLTMFSMLAFQDKSVVLPRIAEADAIVFIMAVPVVAGSFAAGLTCNSKANYDRMVVVDEGVVAWRDRDHRYMGVPPYLLGGLLFQGPYKDVPEGTTLTVRPNSRAKVFVVIERGTNGGLAESLPAAGWMRENGAPRWHEMPTMLTYSHDAAAGMALALPPTRGAVAVFSVIVVQAANAPVAPVEISCGCGRPAGVASPAMDMDLVPLLEGSAAWLDEPASRLSKVPEWMLGATLVRGPQQGPPAGAVIAVRPVAPSVVYAVVEESADGKPGRSGGLLPSVLPGSGWEPRQDVPEWPEGSKLAVFAKRVTAREVLCLPTIAEEGAVFMLVVKVDLEAFDASMETTLGLEYCRAPMVETAVAWSDRQNRWAWVPTFMTGGILFQGPHDSMPTGTTLRVTASGAFRIYVIVEAEYKGGSARSGGFLESLPEAGWQTENSAPSWGDNASTMKVFSLKVAERVELTLPPTSGVAVFSVVLVSLASGPDRLAQELKRSFRAWDGEGKGGIRKDDLGGLLEALCPALAPPAREELLAWADRGSTGVVAYEEFIDRVVLASSAA